MVASTLPDPGRDDKQTALVKAMFDRVAPRYDLINTVLSMGRDARWRRIAAHEAARERGTVLDVAAGTGALSRDLLAAGADAVVALDFSWEMLTTGISRHGRDRNVRWINGDGMSLPFPDESFAAVAIGFGLRNLPDPINGLREFARVVARGGRLVVLEFSMPVWTPLRLSYKAYLKEVLPRMARMSSDPDSYGYLAESIRRWPDQDELCRWIAAAGWQSAQYLNLSGGIVAVHRAIRVG